MKPPTTADFAVITVLPESFEALRRIAKLSQDQLRRGYQWIWGHVGSPHQEKLVVVLGNPLDRENVPVATFVSTLLDAWNPRCVLLVDIGGGVKGREGVRLGDVVTHTMLHYYDFHKKLGRGNESPRHFPLAPASTQLRELSRRPAQRDDHSWIRDIGRKRPNGGQPRVIPGEMLVGGAIQSDSPQLHQLLRRYPKAIAVEMEGVGAARAVLDHSVKGTPPEFLVIRGVSDYCNQAQERNQATRDRWRRFAATAAAAHAHSLIREAASSSFAESSAAIRPSTHGPTSHRPPSRYPINNLWEAARSSLVGRQKDLDTLKSLLGGDQDRGQVRLPHVIFGEAGMGKSALAREAAEEVAPRYSACWWIDGEDKLKIRTALRELARRLGIPSARIELRANGTDSSIAHRFLSDMRDLLNSAGFGGRALVVLDNIDDPQLKHDLPTSTLRYLPQDACDVIITSQSSRWHGVAGTSTKLSGLSPRKSVELVAEESGRAELLKSSDVELICEEFGGRPLFLKLVASLFRDGEDPKAFHDRLRRSPEEALIVLPGLEDFGPLPKAIFNLSIERAEAARSGARQLLETMAFIAPEPIPLSLLRETAARSQEFTAAHVDASLNTLSSRSLIQPLGHRGTEPASCIRNPHESLLVA